MMKIADFAPKKTRNESLIADYQKKLPPKEIAAKYGISRQRVFQILDKYEIPRHQPMSDEERKAKKRAYYQAHKAEHRERKQRWLLKNRDKANKRMREWRQSEAGKEYYYEYDQRPERVAYRKAYYQKNKERIMEWREKNKERLRAYQKEYQKRKSFKGSIKL